MAEVKTAGLDGDFKPSEPVQLEEDAAAYISPTSRLQRDPDDPTGWKAINRLIGISHDEGGPTDIAENHDEYLYGSKRHRSE